MLLGLSGGRAKVENILESEDVLRTIEIYRELGLKIYREKEKLIVDARKGLSKPSKDLYCGNSGTTMRLMAGILSGMDFPSVLRGDESLSTRPMNRIIDPLKAMGRKLSASGNTPPIYIDRAESLKGIDYKMPMDSAQVKSAILLAGLFTQEEVSLLEKNQSRDHTERMLSYLGVDLKVEGRRISLGENRKIEARDLYVPGDISSAAYFIALALLLEGSDITIRNVGINKSRIGLIEVFQAMGGDIRIFNKRSLNNEDLGDIRVRSSDLRAITIEEEQIGSLIDEVPIISVVAAFAEGTSYIKGLEELKYKETNRLDAVVDQLTRANVVVDKNKDVIIINGKNEVRGNDFTTYGDHRMAMSLFVLSKMVANQSSFDDLDCINISFPEFFEMYDKLKKEK